MKMEMHAVNSPVVKVDARALVTGKPVYTDDLERCSAVLTLMP